MISDDGLIEAYLRHAARMGLIRTWWQAGVHEWWVLPLDGEAVEYDREGITKFVYLLNGAGIKVVAA